MEQKLDTLDVGLGRLPSTRSLDDLVYRTIKEAILAQKLKAGAPLVEADLAAQLGVSKTPVRSALRRLQAERFVVKKPYSGTYVSDMSLQDIRDLYLVRSVLEGLAVRMSTPLYSDRDIQEMEALLRETRQALDNGELDRSTELGREWHSILRRPLRRRLLHDLLTLLGDHVERGRWVTAQSPGSAEKSIEEHLEVLAAIQARDAELAEALVRGHLMRVVMDFEATETGMPRG